MKIENELFVGKVKCLPDSGLYDPPSVTCVDLPTCDGSSRCKGDVHELTLGQTCPAKCGELENPSVETLRCELQEDKKSVALNPSTHTCSTERCVAPDEDAQRSGFFTLPEGVKFVERGESIMIECKRGYESDILELVCDDATVTLSPATIACQEIPKCDVACDNGKTQLELEETCKVTPTQDDRVCKSVEVTCTRDGIDPKTQKCICAACELPEVVQASLEYCGEKIEADGTCNVDCLSGIALYLSSVSLLPLALHQRIQSNRLCLEFENNRNIRSTKDITRATSKEI